MRMNVDGSRVSRTRKIGKGWAQLQKRSWSKGCPAEFNANILYNKLNEIEKYWCIIGEITLRDFSAIRRGARFPEAIFHIKRVKDGSRIFHFDEDLETAYLFKSRRLKKEHVTKMLLKRLRNAIQVVRDLVPLILVAPAGVSISQHAHWQL